MLFNVLMLIMCHIKLNKDRKRRRVLTGKVLINLRFTYLL